MRFWLLFGLSLLGAKAMAMNPDGDGYVTAGGQWGTSFPGQRASFSSGTDQIIGISSYALEALWTQPLAERLSLRAIAVTGWDVNEIRFHGTSGFLTGDATGRTDGSYNVLGGGLRFFTGAGFDPWVDRNPDGRSGWPVLQVLFQQLERSEVQKTVTATGVFAGNSSQTKTDLETQQMDLSTELPMDPHLTVGLDYHKEIKVRSFHRSEVGAFNWDYGSTGDHEGVGGGLDFHFRPWEPASEADRSPYLPHVGIPGQCRLSAHYLQNYNLLQQKLSYRAYDLDASYVLAQGLGLSIGWQGVDYGTGGPLKSGNGVTVTQDDPWGQSWNASVSYGWGTVRGRASDGQPASK